MPARAVTPTSRLRSLLPALLLPLLFSPLLFSPLLFSPLLPAAFAAEPASQGTAAVTVPLRPIQIAPHSWYVQGLPGMVSVQNQGFNANAGFVITGAGVVVFDALGTPGLGVALLREIRQRTSLPIRRVIVSHYHADHFYGLQAFKQAGAEIWAHRRVQGYLAGDGPRTRLAERQQSLAPWVPRDMPLLAPDRYLDRDESFTLGGLQFQVRHIGPAHTAEDLMLLVKQDGVAFVGDLIFTGRVPFVGDADSRAWLAAIDRLLVDRPTVLVPGHGPASRDPQADLVLTRDYLLQLRKVMGDAVRDFVPVDEAVKGADWSRFSALPAFEAAHRINAYGTYLQMEREALAAPK